ncbi:MAG: O-antigen ligase family protein [Gemmatimonadaceae bacterium]
MPPAKPPTQSAGGTGVAALVVLQLGALAVVLAATPFKPFELDRFFVPKELALHVAALLAGLLCLWRVRSIELDRVDMLLLLYGALSFLSALLAPNRWVSTRAFAVTASGLAIYWCSRWLAGVGLRRPLMAVIVFATVAGAGTALAQAYGVESDYFTLSRAPGGTFGNRNFMAHLSAIGAPLLAWYAVTARRGIAVFLCALGAAVLAAGLVLSRSRAAWLALLVVGALVMVPMWRAARKVPHADAGRRLILLSVFAAAGVVAALALPNRLNWKSDSPYLDSVRQVAAYNSGSGRGRIIQYRNTLHMVEAHPVLGVGPGNWGVYYPKFASRNDPSLARDDGMTANPWPSSDWVALIAERGLFTVLVLVLAVIGVIANAFRGARGSAANNPAARDPFLAVAVTATALLTAGVGMFDAVLLLATPTLIMWAALGALSNPGRARREWALSPPGKRRLVGFAGVFLLLFTVRSGGQTIAMNVFQSGNSLAAVRRASLLDPGSYRIQLRLAELFISNKGCAAARPYAERASSMFPAALEPKMLLRRCGEGDAKDR